MIGELMSEALLFATAGLVALPLLSRRFRHALRPDEHVRFNSASIISGLVFLEVALLVCALPVVASVGSGHLADRHFFPGDAFIGWTSAGIAALAALAMILGFVRFRRIERSLRVEPWIGSHERRDDHDLVVLDADEPMAYALGGADPQIVVTTGLVKRLPPDELQAVLDHELAHIRLGQGRFLALLVALEPIAQVVRPLRHVTAAARFAIEHSADAGTGDAGATRRALVRLGGRSEAGTVAVAAFAVGEIAERIHALSVPPQERATRGLRPLLYFTAFGLAGLSLSTLIVYWI